MFICQTVNSESTVLGNAVLYSFIQKSAAVRFGSLNTLLTLPVEKDCVGEAKPCARGAKPVTLFY